MKLYTFIFILLSSCAIQSAEQPKPHIAISMPAHTSIWSLTEKTTRHDGSSVEKYHLSAGPDQLPIEIQALAWLATTQYCCCKKSIEKYVTNYKNEPITKYEPDTKILREFYPFKKLDK